MSQRTATVLFTDLVGSTELRGRLGEETADELRRQHDRLMSEVVRLLAGGAADVVVDRGFLDLKGLDKAISACEVRWQPVGVSRIPIPALLTNVDRIFVGRDAELGLADVERRAVGLLP